MLRANGNTYTGSKMELCTVCNNVFNNTRAGDKHRVIESKYAIIRRNGKIERVSNDDPILNRNSTKVLSMNNERRRCLTPQEMHNIGMNQEKNGAWNAGGYWKGPNS